MGPGDMVGERNWSLPSHGVTANPVASNDNDTIKVKNRCQGSLKGHLTGVPAGSDFLAEVSGIRRS